MKRFDALKTIMDCLHESLVITSTGMISRETFAAKDRKENFYMVGSMGLVTPLALGVALSRPDKNIIGIEGDGSILLNLGSMAMVGAEKPDNLLTVVMDNGCYESTGGQYCISREVNLTKIADSAGYLNVVCVEYEDSLNIKLRELLNKPGPNFIRVIVESSRQDNIPRVSHTPDEIRERFMSQVQK